MWRLVYGAGVLVRRRTLQKCNETIHRRLCLDDGRDYECSNFEYSMDRLRQESSLAARSWRPESILQRKGQTARAALSFVRFDRLQPPSQVMRRLRPSAAGGLPVHGHGGRERRDAFED